MKASALAILLFIYSIQVLSFDFESMENSESRFNKRQSNRLCTFMSLETMFPDRQARELASASRAGNVKLITDLVNKGANVNHAGTGECSILFWAMSNSKGVEQLLKLKANPNIIFNDGGSVIHWAVKNKNTSLLKLLIKYGANIELKTGWFKSTPIFDGISLFGPMGTLPDTMTTLINAGANINAIDSSGNTPLLIAAGLGRFDIVYLLIDLGANHTAVDNNGNSLRIYINKKRKAFLPGSEHEIWLNKVSNKFKL